jgi:DNA helicase-2/ATP-dependent DNA helicase PcrA
VSSYLEHLNPAQREAVEHVHGPLLVLAGAGAGKTRVIAHRILHIVRSGISPERILAITFTNKAAREMRERVEMLLRDEPSAQGERLPFISTFHSLGLSIIKENYREFGFKRFPVVYDRSDSMRALKSAMKDAGVDEELEPRMVLSVISRNKGDGMTPEEFAGNAQEPRSRAIAEVWRRYERALADDQALDFDDLLARAVALLSRDEKIRARYRDRWQYVHIDEYQDTNRIQSAMANLLLSPEQNICAVGDIDQTIYTWRGADIRNIMQFEKEYAGARVVLLEENYRSTKAILSAANACISKNQYRVEKNLFTKNEDGAALSLYQAFNETDEAGFVARTIDELIERKVAPRDIAVLYRANFQSRALEEALLAGNIPYQVLGTRFFERAEVKDALAYLRAALFGAAADIARIANTPRRGIGKTTLLALLSNMEEKLRADARKSVGDFRALLARIAQHAQGAAPSEALRFAIRESWLERDLKADRIEGAERLENLRELIALASRYDALPPQEAMQKFLEDAALASDQDELKEDQNAVRLMTVHAAKGLEFPYVFITGLEEGLFPYGRDGESDRDKEEERRLMYVALTRAQKKIYLSFASMRTVFGSQSLSEPSQFLADIPQELLELEAPERLGRTIYLE